MLTDDDLTLQVLDVLESVDSSVGKYIPFPLRAAFYMAIRCGYLERCYRMYKPSGVNITQKGRAELDRLRSKDRSQ